MSWSGVHTMRHEHIGVNYWSKLPKCQTSTSFNPGFLPESDVLRDIFLLEDCILFYLLSVNHALTLYSVMKLVCVSLAFNAQLCGTESRHQSS